MKTTLIQKLFNGVRYIKFTKSKYSTNFGRNLWLEFWKSRKKKKNSVKTN